MSEPHTYEGIKNSDREKAQVWLATSTMAALMTEAMRKRHVAKTWGKSVADEIWIMQSRKLI